MFHGSYKGQERCRNARSLSHSCLVHWAPIGPLVRLLFWPIGSHHGPICHFHIPIGHVDTLVRFGPLLLFYFYLFPFFISFFFFGGGSIGPTGSAVRVGPLFLFSCFFCCCCCFLRGGGSLLVHWPHGVGG
jgi:hypothetical protein